MYGPSAQFSLCVFVVEPLSLDDVLLVCLSDLLTNLFRWWCKDDYARRCRLRVKSLSVPFSYVRWSRVCSGPSRLRRITYRLLDSIRSPRLRRRFCQFAG